MAINITASAIVLSIIPKYGVVSHSPPAIRDPNLDKTFINCRDSYSAGMPVLAINLVGEWFNICIDADPIDIIFTLIGYERFGVQVESDPISISFTLGPADGIAFISGSEMTVVAAKKNWVKWSDIGSVDFTIKRGNVAGERPLDWSGWVYQIKKLLNKVVVYGENGVSLLMPAGSAYGLDTIYRIGLKSRYAVAGDDKKHFFVDSYGQFWKLSDSFKLLNYQEFLINLNNNTVLSYDSLNNLVYICDGVVGFVYDVVSECLGQCSPYITGIGYKSSVAYITASQNVSTDPFEIVTDIYDLGNRANKAIYSLEFGMSTLLPFYAAIDYRRNNSLSFVTTPWYLVGPTGKVSINAFGREFRFRAKLLTYDPDFSLDYIKINGEANAY